MIFSQATRDELYSPGLAQRDGKRDAQERIKSVTLLKAMRACQRRPEEEKKRQNTEEK